MYGWGWADDTTRSPIAADTFTALAALQPAHAVDLRCLAAAGNHLFSAGGDPFGASARGFVKRWSLGGGLAAVPEPTPLVASDTYFTGTVRRPPSRVRCVCVRTRVLTAG